MKIKLVGCIFILDEIDSKNIKKNNQKVIKVLVDEHDCLMNTAFSKNYDIKNTLRNNIEEILGSDTFHLEQVYTLGDKKFFSDGEIDIIYIAVTNINHVENKLNDYQLKTFDIKNNEIILGERIYDYYTEQRVTNGGIEYFHIINTDDIKLEKNLLEVLISYKYLKSRINNTDILFKFLPDKFTLDDIRQVYELIVDKPIDKSNFRKRIINYVEEVDEIVTKGYRPAKLYKFKLNKNDIWI